MHDGAKAPNGIGVERVHAKIIDLNGMRPCNLQPSSIGGQQDIVACINPPSPDHPERVLRCGRNIFN